MNYAPKMVLYDLVAQQYLSTFVFPSDVVPYSSSVGPCVHNPASPAPPPLRPCRQYPSPKVYLVPGDDPPHVDPVAVSERPRC